MRPPSRLLRQEAAQPTAAGEDILGPELPEPLGPMMQVNLLKGPMTWRPRHDLKFSTNSTSKRLMAAPSAPQRRPHTLAGESAGSASCCLARGKREHRRARRCFLATGVVYVSEETETPRRSERRPIESLSGKLASCQTPKEPASLGLSLFYFCCLFF